MKLLRTPLILMAAAAAIAGAVYFVEFHRPPTSSQTTVSPTTATSPARLFEFQEREIQGLSIKTVGTTVVLEKEKTWMVRSPLSTVPASEAVVAFLTNLLMSPRERVIQVPATRRSEFGLDQPLATIEITTVNQQRHRLILGQLNFDRTGLYALVDPSMDPNADLSVMVVPTSFESAVVRNGLEWRNSTKPSMKPQ
ncbi:MAG: DUF4340 domain-containing protein [Alkalinema sp. CAN_BIN05]|nr:DUF4340 domain-containing protein [Alkalinema sp. CAN_BIN05]